MGTSNTLLKESRELDHIRSNVEAKAWRIRAALTKKQKEQIHARQIKFTRKELGVLDKVLSDIINEVNRL